MHAHQERKEKNEHADMMFLFFDYNVTFFFLEQWQIGGSAQDRMVQP